MNGRRIPNAGFKWLALGLILLTACRSVAPDQAIGRSSDQAAVASNSSTPNSAEQVSPRSTEVASAASPTAEPASIPLTIQLAITAPDAPAGLPTPSERDEPTTTREPRPSSTPLPTTPSRSTVSDAAPAPTSSQSSTQNTKVVQASSASQTSPQAVYQLCGQSDAAVGQAIGEFIAGRSYSAQLIGRSNGCANLTITILSAGSSGISNDRTSTHLSVTTDGRNIVVDIVSENGRTQANVRT